jgi:hypothetical protein
MRRPAVLVVVWSVLALSSQSCATRGELRDDVGSIDGGAAGSPFVQQKADAVERAIRLLGELAEIARTHPSHYPDPKLQTEIRELLAVLETVEDLSQFALLASAMAGSQNAEHQNYDGVFDFAQWACVRRIASIPGEEANVWLEHVLKPVLGRDGHPSEEFTELIAKQKRLSKSP